MSDPVADARRAADAARAGIRSYEDAVLAEADRQDRLERMRGKANATATAGYAARFPALRNRGA